MYTNDINLLQKHRISPKNYLKVAENKQNHPIILEKSMKSQQNPQKVAQTIKK